MTRTHSRGGRLSALAGRLPLLALSLAVGTLAYAAGGRIPIAGPTVITQPGSYYVTRDFAVVTGPAFLVNAANVTIDLNGHTITQNDPASDSWSFGECQTGAAIILNGTIVGGRSAIRMDACVAVPNFINLTDLKLLKQTGDAIHIEGSFTSPDINTGSVWQINNVAINGCGGDGVHVQIGAASASGAEFRGEIRRTQIIGCAGDGVDITVDGNIQAQHVYADEVLVAFEHGDGIRMQVTGAGGPTAPVSSLTVRRSEISSCDGDGVEATADSLSLRYTLFLGDSVIAKSGGHGVNVNRVSGGIVQDLSVRNSGGSGIALSSASNIAIRRSTLSSNTVHGLVGTDSIEIAMEELVASSNGGDGIRVCGARTAADGNLASANAGWGLNFGSCPTATANVYSRNRTQGNTAGGINPGSGNIDGGSNF